MKAMAADRLVLPGQTIGMVGGGQLGRMFAMAASRLGYNVVVFCEREDEPAAQVATRTICGALDDREIVHRFAQICDVITLEFENIPAQTMQWCNEHAPVYPSAEVLATTQDRLKEKTALRGAGLDVTPFAEVRDRDSLIAIGNELSWPLIVKTATSGYDGKGQFRLESAEECDHVDWSACDRWIAEKLIRFEREISVVVARSTQGEHASFPVFENEHRHHILDITISPARVTHELSQRAREMALHAADVLGVIGLLCVEMFVDGDQVMINEVAPRPHNSGHLTIEACHTSQFEQHVRAVCGLPLGNTELISGGAAMANLLGDLWHDGEGPIWCEALAVPGVSLHLYGKVMPKAKRKMGHLTVVEATTDAAREKVERARGRLRHGAISQR